MPFQAGGSQAGISGSGISFVTTLTPIAADPHAERLYQKLKEEYGMIVTPSGGELRKILVRVGHLGNVKWGDYKELLTAIDLVKHGL
jgi:aspartate aminotransferase-like enzyme